MSALLLLACAPKHSTPEDRLRASAERTGWPHEEALGTRYQAYEVLLQEQLAAIGAGTWHAFLDESHTSHLISDHALAAGVVHVLEDDGVQLADDLSPAWGAFSTEGSWTDWTDQGFGGDVQQVALVNEQETPADLEDSGALWLDLMPALTVTGTTLTVRVDGDADGYVIADGIRIERLAEGARHHDHARHP